MNWIVKADFPTPVVITKEIEISFSASLLVRGVEAPVFGRRTTSANYDELVFADLRDGTISSATMTTLLPLPSAYELSLRY